ncbi:MAG: Gx transporter family protein [Vallitalea sp.]|jgi:heptaprenyl diphosphate synthase|nr:Gx transporter family protein [Vallitalea sp.]
MPYQNKITKLSKVQKMVFISMLIAFALVLSYIERAIGAISPVPGVKLGLANIITLTSLYFLFFHEALLLVILRVTLNCFFTGSFLSFWYSMSGGLLSFFVMFLLITFSRQKISTIGVSVTGGVFHNIGQLIVVAIMTENINVAIAYFPVLAISGVITGILIGTTVSYLLNYLRKVF